MSGIGEAAAAAAGPVSQVLSNELEKLRQQSNVQNLEVFGFNMERYQVRERQLVLKLEVENKWPRFRNDDLVISEALKFKELWKNKHEERFESEAITEIRRPPDGDGPEILHLDWGQIVKSAGIIETDQATCFLVVSLPESRQKLDSTVKPPSNDQEMSYNIDPDLKYITL